MSMGRRKDRRRTPALWIATNEPPQAGGHPFYQRLNQVLEDHGFDEFVEAQCAPFYATKVGRPSLTPGTLSFAKIGAGLHDHPGRGPRSVQQLDRRRRQSRLNGGFAGDWTRRAFRRALIRCDRGHPLASGSGSSWSHWPAASTSSNATSSTTCRRRIAYCGSSSGPGGFDSPTTNGSAWLRRLTYSVGRCWRRYGARDGGHLARVAPDADRTKVRRSPAPRSGTATS